MYNGQVIKDMLALEKTSNLIQQLAFSFADEESSFRKVKQLTQELMARMPDSQLGLGPRSSMH